MEPEKRPLIEIIDVEPVNKGALLARCAIRIAPWRLTIRDVKIFEKGTNRWVGLPSREYQNPAGETKYYDYLVFDTDAVKSSFRDQVIKAFDEFLITNPEMKPDPVVKFGEEVPF